jgi:ArsR family transcriptional regulator
VKISKHLGYLRARSMVQCERRGNWMVYAIPARPSKELAANLACLQDCAREDPAFQRDLVRLKRLTPKLAKASPCGCTTAVRG